MIKIGLYGLGYLGSIHLKCLLETDFEIQGVYDPNPEKAKNLHQQYGVRIYEDPNLLLKDSDAIDVVSSSYAHFQTAKMAIDHGKHIFIEKPVCSNSQEAKELMHLAKDSSVKIQVGHIERFNPAFQAYLRQSGDVKYIASERSGPFSGRGIDVSILQDLAIHDLDLVLRVFDEYPTEIKAIGQSSLTQFLDEVEAELSFSNNRKASIKASRASDQVTRQMQIFEAEKKYVVNFLDKSCLKLKYMDRADLSQLENLDSVNTVEEEYLKLENSNQILDELNSFYESIKLNKPTQVSLSDGYRALRLADEIESLILEKLMSK